jgi:hypothetical protein
MASPPHTDAHIMRVAREAPAATTGCFVLELNPQRQDKGQHQFNKRRPIAEQLHVGSFILKLDSDGAVFSGPFRCWPQVSLQRIRS